MKLIKTMLLAAAMTSAAAIASPAAAQVEAVVDANADAPILTLAVNETIDSAPDTATIGAGVQTTAPTATEALRQNSRAMDALIAAVKARGVPDRDIQTTGINLHPQYDYSAQQRGEPPRFIGYMVSNQVQVRTEDIDELGELLDALVAAGGTNINGPWFSIDEDSELRVEARRRAIANAREQAMFYARQTGYSNVRLLSITESQGFYGPPPPPAMMARDAIQVTGESRAPVEPGQVSTSVMINFQYQLLR